MMCRTAEDRVDAVLREVECLGEPATGGLSALTRRAQGQPRREQHVSATGRGGSGGRRGGPAVDLEPHVRRALVDAPAVRQRLHEMQAPAADLGGGPVAGDRHEADALVDTSTRRRRGSSVSTSSVTAPCPPYFTEFVMSSETRSLTSETMSPAMRPSRRSIARRAAPGALASRGMSKVTVLDTEGAGGGPDEAV